MPVRDRHLGTVAQGHLGGGRLDLMGQSRHQTINRTLAAAALPKVIGGPL
jgi:hypothetical protein